jgi:hypothetical protein
VFIVSPSVYLPSACLSVCSRRLVGLAARMTVTSHERFPSGFHSKWHETGTIPIVSRQPWLDTLCVNLRVSFGCLLLWGGGGGPPLLFTCSSACRLQGMSYTLRHLAFAPSYNARRPQYGGCNPKGIPAPVFLLIPPKSQRTEQPRLYRVIRKERLYIHLVIYCLFNDAVSRSDFIVK